MNGSWSGVSVKDGLMRLLELYIRGLEGSSVGPDVEQETLVREREDL